MAKVKVIIGFLDKEHAMVHREQGVVFFCGDDRAKGLADKGFVTILKLNPAEKKEPVQEKEKKTVVNESEKKEIKKP